MEIAELHAGWTEATATSFMDRRIRPRLVECGLAGSDGADMTLVRFAPRSAIFRYERGGASYAVKLCGPSTPPEHTVDAAFAWLRKLRCRDPAQTRVPSTFPVMVLPDLGTIVVEWIDAPNIRQRIMHGDLEGGRAGVAAAFRWLEGLHEIEQPVPTVPVWEQFIEVPQGILKPRAEHMTREDRARVQAIFHSMERLAGSLRTAPCELRLLHLDATCANFLFDGTRAIGIDLHETRRSDPLLDYCKLLVDADALLYEHAPLEPPFAIGRELQDLLMQAPALRGSPHLVERVRLQFLSVCLINYARRVASSHRRVVRERTRHLRVAEALASDAFVAAAAP